MLAVEVAGEIEQVHLQLGPPAVVHRRAQPQARRTIARIPPPVEGANRKDPGQGRPVVPQLHVGRRVTDSPPELVAGYHPAADAVRAAEQRFGLGQPARGERRAHCRTRHAHALLRYRRHRLQAETVFGGSRLQQREIAGAAGAEAEVVADQQPAHREPVEQHVLDEILRRAAGVGAVEAADMHAFDAVGRKQFQFLSQRREPRRRRLRREQFERMRFESEHACSQAQGASPVLETRKHCLVSAVHAVEVADGQRRRRRAASGKAAANPHIQNPP